MKGFTLFFAVLVSSLALAIGIAIYDLTIRELDLSATATQSQYAIYAADTGAECALYWDAQCKVAGCNNNSVFATSSTFTAIAGSSGFTCNSIDITNNSVSGWSVSTLGTAATTTFSITFSPLPYCASVVVAKHGTPSLTTITAHGYNVCNSTGVVQIERVLQVNY